MPGAIHITRPRVEQTSHHVMVSADYVMESAAGQKMLLHRASFRFAWDGEFCLAGGEAFVTLGLMPAMKLGLPLVSEAPVAPQYAARLSRLQGIIGAWFGPEFKSVEVRAPERPPIPEAGRGQAAFFSCGVDSFYTVHVRRKELDRLIFIDGFDVDLHQTQHRLLARRGAEEAAAALGLPLVVVETDARFFLDRYATWRSCGGTVAGAIAQLFAGEFHTVHFGSSHVWRIDFHSSDSYSMASQYSLADQEFSVDAMHILRMDKVAALADCPAAMQHLRVCWNMCEDRLNCGRCEKCLRTMAALHARGALDKCATLPHEMDWTQVMVLGMRFDYTLRMWNAVRAVTTEPESRKMLDDILSNAAAGVAAERLWSTGKELTETEGWAVLARKLGKPMLGTAWKTDREWYVKKCRQHLRDLRDRLFQMSGRRRCRVGTERPKPGFTPPPPNP